MSWLFSTAAPAAAGGAILHPPSDRFSSSELFGPLTNEDTEWLCAGGFCVETQTFYTTLPGGKLLMSQVIHSSVGMYWPQIQFTFRLYDPTTSPPTIHWKSVPVTHFITPATPKHDRRSAKSDQFSILVDPANPDVYVISGQYDTNVQVNLTFRRSPGVPGWKVGKGPEGGMTYFGVAGAKPAAGAGGEGKPHTTGGADGFMVHRFWPRCEVEGVAVVDGKVVDVGPGSTGIFIHAIQGARPNVIAANWNFANFQQVGVEAGKGTSLTMMEFTTPDNYGTVTVNVGSIVVDGKLVAITTGKRVKGQEEVKEGVKSTATHEEKQYDPFTTYKAPGRIVFDWQAPTVDGSGAKEAKAKLVLELDNKLKEGSTDANALSSKGLIEKVDVLGEIPYLVKKVVAYAAGTKPYIYQWFNPAKATVEIDGNSQEIEGYLFNEATFISETA